MGEGYREGSEEWRMAMRNDFQDNPGVIAPPPLIYAGVLVVGLLLRLIFPTIFIPRPLALIIGAGCTGISCILAPAAFLQMRRAKTNVDPTQPATAIVTEGPFRFTRNPIYLSLTLFYTGMALVFQSLWALLLLPVVLFVMNRGVIDREERYLERKFGEQYVGYKARVRRWI